MKKILVITFEYPMSRSYCGGVGQIVKQSRRALLDLQQQVYVLMSGEFQKSYPVKVLCPDGSILCYPSFSSFRKQYNLRRFHYIIQHFVNWTDELQKLKNGRSRRPKIIYHFHSLLRREKDYGFKVFNHFLWNQERMFKIADNIICPSHYEYSNFLRYFPHFSDKIFLIENTIETFPLREDMVRNIRTRYGIKENDIVSIYVGRIEKIKGAGIIIECAPEVLKKYKNLKIFVVGKVLERDLHRRLLKVQKEFPNQVFYIRYLEKNRLFQHYYVSDIYLNTSLSESFSLTTHESAACNNALLLNTLPVFDKFKDAAIFFSSCDRKKEDFISKFEYLIRNKRIRDNLSGSAVRIANNFLVQKNLTEDFRMLLRR